MTQETFVAILTFLGAILAAVLYVLDRTNRRVADSLPPATIQLMLGVLEMSKALAKSTATTADDELVDRLIKLLEGNAPAAKSDDGAVG